MCECITVEDRVYGPSMYSLDVIHRGIFWDKFSPCSLEWTQTHHISLYNPDVTNSQGWKGKQTHVTIFIKYSFIITIIIMCVMT